MMNVNEDFSLVDVCYEQIRDHYYYGLFGDFKLIIDTKTGYFNATKLCADGGKHLYNWIKNKDSKVLMKYMCEISDYSDPKKLFLKTVRGARDDIYNKVISGTYLPEELILSLAIWISKEFYFKVYHIIRNYFAREFKDKYKNVKEQLNSRLEEVERDNKQLRSKLSQVEEKNLAFESLLQEIRKKHESFRDDVAPKTLRDGQLNMLVVVRKNAGETMYPYYVVRCQKQAYGQAMRKLRRRFPDSKVVHQISYNPNAINLFNRIKGGLGYVSSRANHLRVTDFERFKRDLESLIPKLE